MKQKVLPKVVHQKLCKSCAPFYMLKKQMAFIPYVFWKLRTARYVFR